MVKLTMSMCIEAYCVSMSNYDPLYFTMAVNGTCSNYNYKYKIITQR